MSVGPVRNRFKVLLANKELEEGRKITYQEIQSETGIDAGTLSAWANNRVTRYDADKIAALCDYFGISAGELLEYPLEIGQEDLKVIAA